MLLDTNAISAWAKQDPSLMRVLRGDRPWFLPSIALGEYRFGVLNSNQKEALERWLVEVEACCIVLSPDAVTARHYAAIRNALRRNNTPIPYEDIWIAALAEQHGLDVITRDAHFDFVSGLRRIGW
jgi:tRNA(fMet)-specific endonuclease VapC